jgi:hypothetical protein
MVGRMTHETLGCAQCAEFAYELLALEQQLRADAPLQLSETPGPGSTGSKLPLLLMRALTARSNRRHFGLVPAKTRRDRA